MDMGVTCEALLGPVTVPPVPAGAAGAVGGPGFQCHAPAGAGGECGGNGRVWGGYGSLSPSPCASARG